MTAWQLWSRAQTSLGFNEWADTEAGREAIAAQERSAEVAPGVVWVDDRELMKQGSTGTEPGGEVDHSAALERESTEFVVVERTGPGSASRRVARRSKEGS
jgi:hypothetical protein